MSLLRHVAVSLLGAAVLADPPTPGELADRAREPGPVASFADR